MAGDSDKAAQIAFLLKDLNLPDGINLREWAPADFPVIQALSSAEGWTTPQSRPVEALRAWQNSWPVLVLTADEKIIGFLRALSDGEITTYIAEVLIAPEWRGQGLGTLLLETCHRLVPDTRFDLLSVEKSGSFYMTHGFREFWGFRKSDFTG